MKFKLQGRTTERVSENSVSELFRQVIHQYNRAECLGWMDGTISELAGMLEDHLRGTPGWFLDLGTAPPGGVRTGFTGGSGFTSGSGDLEKILETQEERTSTEVQHVEPVVRNRRAE